LHTVHAAGFLFAGAKALRSLSCLALNPRRRDADLVHRQADQPANGGRDRVGVATSAVPRGSTVEPAAAELPFARSRDGVRETYIVSFGLFGAESVFASEAQKAAQILRARLQAEAQVLVRFNDKRGGNATSATLAAALRSAGQAMVPEKDILVVFLTSRGSPDGLAVVAGRRSETLSPRSFRSMLNSSGARYRVVITPRRRHTRPHSAVRTGQPGPILGMRS
jgi:hypothetical protein